MRFTILLVIAAMAVISRPAVAQSNAGNFWKEIANDAISIPENAVREFEPDAYISFDLDYEAIRTYLTNAPREWTEAGNKKPLHLDVPQADGTFETFAVVETPLVSEHLRQKYPLIRSYTGYALREKSKRITITVSPDWGFKATIRRTDRGVEYIEPLAKGQSKLYMVYDRLAFPAKYYRPDLQKEPDFVELPVKGTEHEDHDALPTTKDPAPENAAALNADPVTLKIYRFACATTGQFAQDHGGTTASVLAAMINYVAQLNQIYEPELAIRLILIDNVESILFLNPDTDPYTGTLVPGWRDQNPEAMIQTIGFDSYDIGHVFARYIEGPILGQASLSSCCTDFKGLGCSGGNLPYGDPFLNTIGHEIGHQWSAGHTFNYCTGNEGASSPNSACEPGSGTTIMSYSGACGPDNISGGTLGLYYNVCSLSEIREFVRFKAGSTCGENMVTTNMPPQINSMTAGNFTIPKSTPFVLNAAAVDPDGDPVVYCWEQADLGPLLPLGQAQNNSPLFRSYPPADASERVFPRIQSIVGNQSPAAELLPTYSRNMKFAITVRDQKMGGGGVTIDTVLVKVNASAGPFRVTYPNTANITWRQGEYQYVTWDVANTDQSAVNCQKVNIRLSTDAGLTYPILLVENVPNSGSACVLVPNVTSSTVRVKVEAADNIFFDISNVHLSIAPAVNAGFGICINETRGQACLPGTYKVNVANNATAGFSGQVTYSVLGLPGTAITSFSANPAPAGEDVVLSIDFGTTPEGIYDFQVVASSTNLSDTAAARVTVVSNVFDALALISPADASVGISQSPLLEWTALADANNYQIQIASHPAFTAGSIKLDNAAVTGNTLTASAGLEKGQVYYWRVRPLNECGAGPWAGPFVFSTQVDACASYAATDLPKNISANSTNPVESKISIPSGGAISDVNVKSLKMSHEAFNQMEVKLVSPSGGQVILFKNKCGFSATTMNAGFDDAAAITTFPCPPNNGQILKPQQPLSGLAGQASAGEWKLVFTDNEIGSGGTITEINLEVCSAASLNAPFIVNNNTLSLASGANALITTDLLKADDPDNNAQELIFTLVDVPAFGFLELAGVGQLKVGDQFSQDKIDAGYLRYFDYGFAAATDKFRFAVTDGDGGYAGGTFNIGALVGTSAPQASAWFSLAPNPATESVRLDFGKPLSDNATITIRDAAGRLVQTVQVKTGAAVQTIQLHNYAAGLYTVSVQQAAGMATRKLMVR